METLKMTEEVNLQNDKIIELEGLLSDQRKQIYELQRDIANKDEAIELREKRAYELMRRGSNQLASVIYLLDTIISAGTHHEKEVVIRHLKTAIGNMINNTSCMPSDYETNLPF